jgi:steroid 5-alpha reductase family enzyme
MSIPQKKNTSKSLGLVIVLAAYLSAGLAAWVVGWLLGDQHPLLMLFAADAAATIVVFGFSVGTNNSSMYDPFWSVAPVPIVAYLALYGTDPGVSVLRQVLVVSLVSWWAIRLTYNWARRWHGLADEDFRYFEMRAKVGGLYWPVSFFAFHFMPTVTVFLGCFALYPALSSGTAAFGALDLLALFVTAAAILIESVSDKQLSRFIASKPAPGAIMSSGVWAWSRHPNYFGEILFWWGIFLFGVAAAPASALWTWVGPVWITCLFVFISLPLMDKRMLQRRPQYAEHQRRVSAIVPWPPKRG